MRSSADRRRRGWRFGAVAAALLAAGALALRGRGDVLDGLARATASPETQVREVLAHRDRAVLEGVGGAGGRVELSGVRFGDVAVQVDGGAAQVLAVVEARGTVTFGDERAELGYVGREAFALTRCGVGRWCPEGEELPALSGVLAALRARAEAASAHVRAWQIRVERDRATAGEDYAARGAQGAEPRRVLHELRRDAGRWVFVDAP